VLRTFSKIYGLAGFRVGYGLCPPDVAAACLKVKNAFDVTQSALDAALASLGAGDEVARRRDETREGRERLAAGLRERGFSPLAGVANFLCVPVGDGAAFASRLEREGVIVRPLGPFGDPASVRISVGSREELNRLFAAIDAGES
jgi:histidinol-phosphate aminotransferase